MKQRFMAVLLLALGLFASAAFAQTATVNSLANVTNRAGTYTATYSYTLIGTPTEIFYLKGSATKTVFVQSIKLTCTLTTAAQATVTLVKRTSATTIVSAVAATAMPDDSQNTAATAVPYVYISGTAANPTVGTGTSIVMATVPFLAPGTAAAGANGFSYEWGNGMDQYLTLRGVAQGLAINMAGATLTGAACQVTARWIER